MTGSDGSVAPDDEPLADGTAVGDDGPTEAVDRVPTPQEWGPGSSVGRPDDDGSSQGRRPPTNGPDSDDDDDRDAAPYADGSQAV